MTEQQKQREIIEGNKLIAEFMGLNYQEYNIDWRTLMPVVDEIEKHGHEVSISRNRCIIAPSELKIPCFFYEPKKNYPYKIEAVWQAVVQFIKWYNNQNLSK